MVIRFLDRELTTTITGGRFFGSAKVQVYTQNFVVAPDVIREVAAQFDGIYIETTKDGDLIFNFPNRSIAKAFSMEVGKYKDYWKIASPNSDWLFILFLK